ncbi:type II toxin-antitoxin system HicB family antitoxin [Enterococcus sp. AZ072]|uniref:type II toxin-antitoxin system HicB family antitoxin n=1 Tax=unclassified Enterococcus TaxID=2608891 RepID=UPI003D2A1F13
MHIYYALFNLADDGITIEFPGLDCAFTFGADMHDALYMAKDLLAGWLINAEDDGETIPEPLQPFEIPVPKDDLLIPIEVNTDIYRLKFENQAIKKTLTITRYLDAIGKEQNINFSLVLTEALKEKLGI